MNLLVVLGWQNQIMAVILLEWKQKQSIIQLGKVSFWMVPNNGMFLWINYKLFIYYTNILKIPNSSTNWQNLLYYTIHINSNALSSFLKLKEFSSSPRITNSPIADVFVVWAKCEDNKIRGFILEKVLVCFVTCFILGQFYWNILYIETLSNC